MGGLAKFTRDLGFCALEERVATLPPSNWQVEGIAGVAMASNVYVRLTVARAELGVIMPHEPPMFPAAWGVRCNADQISELPQWWAQSS